MKTITLLTTIVIMLCYQSAAFAQPAGAKTYQQQAAILANDFMATLKPILKKSMLEKGPHSRY